MTSVEENQGKMEGLQKEQDNMFSPSSSYLKQVKDKMNEIDSKIGTVLTIPQYSKHFRTQIAPKPRWYYRENKIHYMSLYEHLTKLYDVEPYIYGVQEEGYTNNFHHVFPYSTECVQCEHKCSYPVDPYDPYRTNPMNLQNESCNRNHLHKWVEFLEIDNLHILRRDVHEVWSVHEHRYLAEVKKETIMKKDDANRLIFLMKQKDFDYESFLLESTKEYKEYLKQLRYSKFSEQSVQTIDSGIKQLSTSLATQEDTNTLHLRLRQAEEEIQRLRAGQDVSRQLPQVDQRDVVSQVEQRKRRLLEDRDTNYYRRHKDDTHVSQSRNTQQTQQRETVPSMLIQEQEQQRVAKPPTKLDIIKKYSKYDVKPSQRDMPHLTTVTHQDPGYQKIQISSNIPKNFLNVSDQKMQQQNSIHLSKLEQESKRLRIAHNQQGYSMTNVDVDASFSSINKNMQYEGNYEFIQNEPHQQISK